MLQPYNLSLEAVETSQNEVWVDIYAAQQNDTIISGHITGVEEHNVGGEVGKTFALVVMLDTVKGIIPLPETGIPRYPIDENGEKKVVLTREEKNLVKRQLMTLVGMKEPLKVTAIHREENIVMLSRAQALEDLAKKTWTRLALDRIVPAKVRRAGRRTVTLDIGGINVTMNGEELTWGFLNDARMLVGPGQKINVKIMELDKENQKLKVSHRETLANPWPDCINRYKKGNLYMGKVTGVIEKGVFINLEPGVDVYCKHLAFERVQPGDNAVVRVTGIDVESKRVWGNLVGNRR